jgi:hypothetical protein
MAASCCASTSTRFVASSSCRARKTRTLAMKNPPMALAHYSSGAGSTRRSMSSPVWPVSPSIYSTPRSVSLRRISSDSLRSQHRSLAEPVLEKAPASGAMWLEYIRRHALSLEDVQTQSTRKQLSAVMAFAVCFLASASTSTSNDARTSGPNPSAKFNQGGGSLKSKKTKPMFLFSKLQAEKDVQKVQEDAAENPYLVNTADFFTDDLP